MHCARIGGRGHGRHVVLGKLPACLEKVVPGRAAARAHHQVPWGDRVGFEETQPHQGSDRLGADDLLQVEIVQDEAPASGPTFGGGGLEMSSSQLVPSPSERE